jgi:hypothetical protein
MADDDDVNPVTGNDDLRAAGLVPDDEDDIQADVVKGKCALGPFLSVLVI